jgi:hypothetical protein
VSYRKYLNSKGIDPVPIMDTCRKGLLQIMSAAPVHALLYEHLDDPEAMEKLHEFIVPEEPFSRSWYEQLQTLRVTQILERVS